MKKIIYVCMICSFFSAFAANNAEISHKKEGVWQEHKQASKAVPDADMELNTDKEPDLREGFLPLFDGTGNDAQMLGGVADFKYEDGILYCKSVANNKKNAFYCTKKNYKGDLILTFDWKWTEGVHSNSGVMLRSGMSKTGWLDGMQIEIEMDTTRSWTAGIYAEGIRKWKYSLSREDHKEARAASRNLYQWNRMTIEYRDGVVKTWSNGVPCAKLKWDKSLENPRREISPNDDFIAFQVHIGRADAEIQFRNIKIKELN